VKHQKVQNLYYRVRQLNRSESQYINHCLVYLVKSVINDSEVIGAICQAAMSFEML
jgi:hypothetical protein